MIKKPIELYQECFSAGYSAGNNEGYLEGYAKGKNMATCCCVTETDSSDLSESELSEVDMPTLIGPEVDMSDWDDLFKLFEESNTDLSKNDFLKIIGQPQPLNTWCMVRKQLKARGYEYDSSKVVQENYIRTKGFIKHIKYIGDGHEIG
tara:strand:+ start:62 stop:508 length:447 start_codon:yes stop_codon:yes gene_type:complete